MIGQEWGALLNGISALGKGGSHIELFPFLPSKDAK